MRTWGRSGGIWVQVITDPNGYNDQIYLTTMLQVFQLALGESPFYAQYGIPAGQSIIKQILPDYYVMLIKQQFASYFASLEIGRVSDNPPTYLVNMISHNGVQFDTQIQVPQ